MSKAVLVAEIGINHNGDMNIVRSLIEEAANAGFDYVKFQKRDVDSCVPKERRNEMKDTPWGRITYLDYKKRLEDIDYCKIGCICIDNKIDWFVSPWDIPSIEFFDCFNIPYIKVASAVNTDIELLKVIRATNVPVIMSTGMTTHLQFCDAYRIVGENTAYILACTSTYPTPDNEMNMKFIETLKDSFKHIYGSRIGFSNHNPGIMFAAASVLYGARMIEVHVTLDRAMFGSDQAASIEPSGMRKLVKYVRAFEEGMGDGNWNVYDSEQAVIKNLRWRDLI